MVKWLAQLASGQMAIGSIDIWQSRKLFLREPAILKIVGRQRTQKKKNNLAALVPDIEPVAFLLFTRNN